MQASLIRCPVMMHADTEAPHRAARTATERSEFGAPRAQLAGTSSSRSCRKSRAGIVATSQAMHSGPATSTGLSRVENGTAVGGRQAEPRFDLLGTSTLAAL